MNRKELEQQQTFIEAQMRWASLYGGDQELLALLHAKKQQLFTMKEQRPFVNRLLALEKLTRPRAATSHRGSQL
jgi:hypothetical protein